MLEGGQLEIDDIEMEFDKEEPPSPSPIRKM